MTTDHSASKRHTEGLRTVPDDRAPEPASMTEDRENRLTRIDWFAQDVMVGPFRTDEQYHINFEKKFYYAPAGLLKMKPSARFIALWRSSKTADPGIHYYGEVTDTRLMKRKLIPVPCHPSRGEEDYYVYFVQNWIRLDKPIRIRGEGVYAPKFTSLFLLLHSTESYELFSIRSEETFRLVNEIKRITGADGVTHDPASENAVFRLTDGRIVSAHGEAIVIYSPGGEILDRISFSDFRKAPGQAVRRIEGTAVGTTQRETP